MHLALTGDRVNAVTLRDIGIVSEVTEPGEAVGRAVTLASRIAGYGQEAVCATKAIIRRAVEPITERDGFDIQESIARPAFESPERTAGLKAFVDRSRPPESGRAGDQ